MIHCALPGVGPCLRVSSDDIVQNDISMNVWETGRVNYTIEQFEEESEKEFEEEFEEFEEQFEKFEEEFEEQFEEFEEQFQEF